MRFIPMGVHGALDYSLGLLLILAPWIFGFAAVPVARWLVILLGIGTIAYSAMTEHGWDFRGLIPMHLHLRIDGAAGVLLIASPWLFGFYTMVWLPHVVLGAVDRRRADDRDRHDHPIGRSRLTPS